MDGDVGIDEDDPVQAGADPLRGLAHRDAGVAVAHEDHIAQAEFVDGVDYVRDVRLQADRDALSVREAGQGQCVDLVAAVRGAQCGA